MHSTVKLVQGRREPQRDPGTTFSRGRSGNNFFGILILIPNIRVYLIFFSDGGARQTSRALGNFTRGTAPLPLDEPEAERVNGTQCVSDLFVSIISLSMVYTYTARCVSLGGQTIRLHLTE